MKVNLNTKVCLFVCFLFDCLFVCKPHESKVCSRMAGFINWECGAERGGGNSDSDFEDGDDGWRPRSGKGRGERRGRGANRIGRGGKNNIYSLTKKQQVEELVL